MAADAGVALLTINAQQRFNEWTSERAGEANALAAYAAQCGAQAIILVPVNGGAEQDDAEGAQANSRGGRN